MTAAGPSAAQRAYAAIRDAIVRGEHAPDTMLSEAELGAALGMSRTPVRAALARLADDGWIRIFPQRGALVLDLSDRQITEIAQARLVLETAGVDLADLARRRALAVDLAPLVEAQRVALAAGDVTTFADLSMEFHQAFAAASGNSYLADVSQRLADRQRRLIHRQRETLLACSDQVIADHRDMLARLHEDDPAGFSVVLRRHLEAHAAGSGVL